MTKKLTNFHEFDQNTDYDWNPGTIGRMPAALWTLGTSFIIALILTPIIRDIFHAYNVVDRPGFRKVHAYPIPRLGGLSVGVAFTIGLARAAGTLSDGDVVLLKILPGAGVVLTVGILDDFFSLSARHKLLGQVLGATVAFWYGLRIETLAGISIPIPISFLLTILWLLLLMNALNLIDGLDGLCAGLGFIAAAGLYTAASIRDQPSLKALMPPLAGALAGFLCYNFSRATMFLGDSGALLIGFLVGAGGILLVAGTPPLNPPMNPLVALMVIAVPLLDLALSIVRRFLANRPIFGADRGHVHHRLLDLGFKTRGVAFVLYLCAGIGAFFGVLGALPLARQWQALIVVGFCAIAVAGASALRYSEFEMAGRLLFAGDLRRIIRRGKKDH